VDLARRLVDEAGVAAITLHPRAAAQHHSGRPDYALVHELVEALDGRVPVIVSGGLRTADRARAAYEQSGADAVMIARGSLGNPWIFAALTRDGDEEPDDEEIEAELRWVIERAAEHWGPERASRNLRKFYPWYVSRLGYEGAAADRFQRAESLSEVLDLLSARPVSSPI
jgi:tRNA-dihydrouridine synthase